MARKPRNEIEAGVAHVWARGNNRQLIFTTDADRRRYLLFLAAAVKDHEWRLLAYCLMNNHVHLLIETTQPNLGEGMQWLHGGYAQWFNRSHFRTGHLFEARFGWAPQVSDEQLRYAARYIALNPVKARLCQYPADWPWSSHRAVEIGIAPAWLHRDRLLEFFAGLGGVPLERYLRYVRTGQSEVLALAA